MGFDCILIIAFQFALNRMAIQGFNIFFAFVYLNIQLLISIAVVSVRV